MYRTIVVGTDGSETAGEAVRQAAGLAKACQARVVTVTAYRPVGDMALHPELMAGVVTAELDDSMKAHVAAVLEQAEKTVRDQGVEVLTESRAGDPAEALLDAAKKHDADLIVVGNRGMTGAKRFLLGSVPNRISHHAPCAVLIVRTC